MGLFIYKCHDRDGSKPSLGMVALMGHRRERGLRQRSGKNVSRLGRRLNGWERLAGSSDQEAEVLGRQNAGRVCGVATKCFSPSLSSALIVSLYC